MNFTLYSAIWADFHPLDVFFPQAPTKLVKTPDDLQGPGILIVHGGADISPSLYNKKLSLSTGASINPSNRDLLEKALVERARELGICVFGICRGAQLMCALAGGYLIQDVTNHESWRHKVETSDGAIFKVNSIHHQMQAPWNIPHELLAWTDKPLSKHYDDAGELVSVPNEPEAVWYPGLGLGVQWHPEMMEAGEPSSQWIYGVLKERFINA